MLLNLLSLSLVFAAYDYVSDTFAAGSANMPCSYRSCLMHLYHHTRRDSLNTLAITEEAWVDSFLSAGLPCSYTDKGNVSNTPVLFCNIDNTLYQYDPAARQSKNLLFSQEAAESSTSSHSLTQDEPSQIQDAEKNKTLLLSITKIIENYRPHKKKSENVSPDQEIAESNTTSHPHVPEESPFPINEKASLIQDDNARVSPHDIITDTHNAGAIKPLLIQIKETGENGYLPAIEFLQKIKCPPYLAVKADLPVRPEYLEQQKQLFKSVEKCRKKPCNNDAPQDFSKYFKALSRLEKSVLTTDEIKRLVDLSFVVLTKDNFVTKPSAFKNAEAYNKDIAEILKLDDSITFRSWAIGYSAVSLVVALYAQLPKWCTTSACQKIDFISPLEKLLWKKFKRKEIQPKRIKERR